jgi:hypothetical protein
MQTYANLCMLGALSAYCFTDAVGKYPPKIAKYLSIAFAVGFVATEGLALFA